MATYDDLTGTWTLDPAEVNFTVPVGEDPITIIGNDLANSITGNDGNNTIDGGAGADILIGGAGDDTYIIDETDTVTEAANEGRDTVEASFTYTLGANLERLVLLGNGNINGTGNGLDNDIIGNDGNNSLVGGGGNDTLNGGSGGIDTLVGGTGNDTYQVAAGDIIVENAGEGTDTVQVSFDYTLGANLENLTLIGIDNINGTGNGLNNQLNGNIGNNSLSGGAGNDTLNGSLGFDTLNGGAGDDTYYLVTDSDDIVIETANGGYDQVLSMFSHTLASNVEELFLVAANLIGTGNDIDNFLRAGDGSHTLNGLAGSDTLDGGGGTDTLVGGTGDDVYVVDNSGDVVTEAADEGYDTVVSSASFSLQAGVSVERLILTGTSPLLSASGNELDNYIEGSITSNVLSGGGGNDTLESGGGRDTMSGGTGDDTYIVSAPSLTIVEAAGQGTDTVISSVSAILSADVERLILTGSGVNGTGNELGNLIQGNGSANTIDGLAGNDTLDGGGGLDELRGGQGDDTYVVESPGATIIEAADEGTDTVRSSASHAVGANVENLVLTGTGNATGTGNVLNNRLTGNQGSNRLDGGAGNDTMEGGIGNDTYVVDSAGDVVTEAAGGGIDTVIATFNYTAGAFVENVIASGTAALAVTGNGLANTLTGNAGANALSGADGNDTLKGGAGNDRLTGGNGNDFLYGGTGNEVLSGGTGNDRLYGGAGKDVLTGGSGRDIFVFDTALNRRTNIDTITDFKVADDTIWLDNKYMAKLGAGTATRPGRLNKDFFAIGDKAQDANDYLVYNSRTGKLFYDVDGSGAKAAVEIAILKPSLKLTAADFMIV